jgi:hypothetical protein
MAAASAARFDPLSPGHAQKLALGHVLGSLGSYAAV